MLSSVDSDQHGEDVCHQDGNAIQVPLVARSQRPFDLVNNKGNEGFLVSLLLESPDFKHAIA